jgi:quinol monooxygenase YgiN
MLDKKFSLFIKMGVKLVAKVKIYAVPEKYEQAVCFLKKHLAETAAYNGCEACHAAGSTNNFEIIIYQEWDTAESYDKYLNWRKETGVMAEFETNYTKSPSVFERLEHIQLETY